VVYDDDDVIPGLSGSINKAPPFTWLVSCASVFLIDATEPTARVLAAEDGSLIPLIVYICDKSPQKKKQIEACASVAVANSRGAMETNGYSHVALVT